MVSQIIMSYMAAESSKPDRVSKVVADAQTALFTKHTAGYGL